MHRKRYVKSTVAFVMGIVMMLASGSAVFALEGGMYHDFRDGEISIYLPESWSSEEISAEESKGKGCEQILKAWDDMGESGLHLDMYFMAEKVLRNDYVYFDDDEDAALEYYEDYGSTALDELYFERLEPEAGSGILTSTWGPEWPMFFDGQWNGFLVTEMKGSVQYEAMPPENLEHTIYLTAKMADDSETVVHNILIFRNDEDTALTEQQAQLAQEIADEFYDYDYYNEMAGAKPKDSLWGAGLGMSSGDEMDVIMTLIIGIVSILAPLGIILGVIVIIAKRAAERSGRAGSAGKSGSRSFSASFTGIGKTLDLGAAISKLTKRRTERASFSGQEQRMENGTMRKEKRAERRSERKPLQTAGRRTTMQMRNREAEGAEQRYYDSLQTLQKSGLLTRDEMRDMLERHERSRARQRNHR